MVQRQKGVIEVQRGDLIWHLGIVGTAWVAIAEDNVMKPIWDNALRVHQVPDSLQHRLKQKEKLVTDIR